MTGPPPETGSPSAQNRRADARYAQKDLATQCVHAGERWERPALPRARARTQRRLRQRLHDDGGHLPGAR